MSYSGGSSALDLVNNYGSNERKKIPQRGIYSEFLGRSSESSRKEASIGPRVPHFKGQPLQPQRAIIQRPPKARSFTRKSRPTSRASKNRQLIEEKKKIRSGLEPKVIVPFQQRPGKPPRRIEIERKKRLFASQDLEELLQADGVDYIKYGLDVDHKTGQRSFLPLHIFDDTEYECRSPGEWVEKGVIDGKTCVPGKALRFSDDGIGRWMACDMIDYDPDTELYTVQWRDDHGGADFADVHRVCLNFDAENPFVFAKRVAVAHESRRNFEAAIRYSLYVDSMPTDEIQPLDTEQVNRILLLSLNTRKLKQNALDTTSLLNEVNIDYARTMNKIIFDVNLKDPNQSSLRDLLQLPEQKEKKAARKYLGVVAVPFHDFPKHFSDFCFHSFFTKLEAIEALVSVNEECLLLDDWYLFNTSITKSVRLEEFEQLQSSAMLSLNAHLKDKWHVALKTCIKEKLRAVGKGWLNLAEENREVYQFSKLKKFNMMINFMMQDSLQFLVEKSIRKYATFLQHAGRYKVRVRATYDVQVVEKNQEFTEPEAAPELGFPPEEKKRKKRKDDKPKLSPRPKPQLRSAKDWALFNVDLVLNGSQLAFSTSPDDIRDRPLMLFDKAMMMMHDIPQLEHAIMEQLFWHGSDAKLASLRKEEDWVMELFEGIRDNLEAAVQPLREYHAQFDQYKEFMELDVKEFVEKWSQQRMSIDDVRKSIQTHLRARAKILYTIPKSIWLGLVTVNCSDVRRKLAAKRQQIVDKQLEWFASMTQGRCKEIIKQFMTIEFELRKEPDDIQELCKIKEFMNTVPLNVAQFRNPIRDCMLSFDVLEEFDYPIGKELSRMRWNTFGWPKKIHDQMERKEDLLEQDKNVFLTKTREDQDAFAAELQDLEKMVKAFAHYAEKNPPKKVQRKASDMHEKLRQLEERATQFNADEMLFGLNATDYRNVTKVTKAFEPFYQLFTTSFEWENNFSSWMTDSFLELDGQEISQLVIAYNKTINKAMKNKAIKDNDWCRQQAEMCKKSLEEFRPFLPLITALRNPGMKPRHWEELSKELPMDFAPDESLTLEKVVKEYELQGYLDVITKIGDTAGKQYQIESALDKMEKAWEGIEFEVVPYKKTQTHVIRGVDDIIQLLDEHLVMTQAMQFSQYKEPFEERIAKWDSKLNTVYEVIEEWLQVQRNWMSLQAIFESPDIKKQLPAEGKRFSSVNKTWRLTMSQVHASPDVLSFCDNPSLLNKLQDANNFLQMVQKRLSDYLDKKRAAFARFYFLANEDLLQILSQTQDPTAVQPHLKKCFENIHQLKFEEGDIISAMVSAEKEVVEFTRTIDPNQREVEHWLTDIENEMKKTVRQRLFEAVDDYPTRPRDEWVTQWPGQCVLAGSQVHWTVEVEDALLSNGHPGIVAYGEKLKDQLSVMVNMVRGELSKIMSLIMGALIVLDVHARDVVDRLIEEKVSHPTAFAWICQLRLYLDGEGKDKNLWVQMVQSQFPYGYEYLGNTLRLVITPLTDRCYMTLMSALSLNLGGAPAGPAGTGKTETVKDLAKTAGKQCVVFNCSEGLNYLAMGKFFKGLASSGAWACFDEFNRIDIEVLSVVAQQIMTIWEAIREHKKVFTFEGTDILLEPTCSVFITMNPGYAGRTELPDNLKALFRPVAMMVPDYALIGEIMLYSFGFNIAQSLARKMVATFKLCSEQLSAQDHYDYGMRAVKTVITRAGILKRENPTGSEDVLLLRALRDVNVPKFLTADLPLFEGIISDLFPGVEKPESDYGALMNALILDTQEQGLQPVDAFLNKCVQLYETTVVRHGLMLVGPTGGGKTSCLRVLSAALSRMSPLPDFEKVKMHIMNPKAVTMGQLYGESDPHTREWADGILAKIVRGCIEEGEENPSKQWVIFDGPVDAIWIENMNTVLDDNKKLCLVSGEILALTPQMTMIFEVEDLAVASPATVSRCGMVYTQPTALGLRPMLKSWVESQHKIFAKILPLLQLYFEQLLEPSIDFIRKHCKEIVPSVDNNLARSCLNLLSTLFKPLTPVDGVPVTSAQEELITSIRNHIEPVFIQSLIWSVGATVDTEGRHKFSSYLRLMMNEFDMKEVPPEAGLVYDYTYDLKEQAWIGWMDSVPRYQFDSRLSYSEIIVPTMDSVRYISIMERLVHSHMHVLLVGDTGTGKTVNAYSFLGSLPENMIPLNFIFSAATSCNQVEDMMFAKMTKRRQRVFGPTLGKRFVIFVDDLNMPAREKYGAQPPIEILRQWMDYGGWYERKNPMLHFVDIVDIGFVGAMGPPGGGRNPVTPRFLRHFNFLAHTEMDNDSLFLIFSTITKNKLSKFTDEIIDLTPSITQATIDTYNNVSQQLLPTPPKPHYTFNLRDLSAVFQGMLSASPRRVETIPSFLRLWLHENQRVFQDRLINDEDREFFDAIGKKMLDTHFNVKWEDIIPPEGVLFCDFLDGMNSEQRLYEEVKDLKKAHAIIDEALNDYNDEEETGMKLVMFLDAIKHVARISRILRQPGGNALLLGVGGSGRQSLTRLATFMSEYEIFTITVTKHYGVTEWHDDVRRLLLDAGLKEQPTVFLLSDTQIVHNSFFEDINNILNSGEVPNIFAAEDLDNIFATCKVDCQRKQIDPTRLNAYQQFIGRVKANLHLVFCMSPVGDPFRERLRMFPALVNCCTIDWFSDWPADALQSVAQTSLLEENLELKDIDAVVNMCMLIHQSVTDKSIQYRNELQRYNYVTPTSFLELLSIFKFLLMEKRAEVGGKKTKLQNGLDTLEMAGEQVAQLQIDLKEKQPRLIITQKEVADTMVSIEADRVKANETREVVAAQEADASEKADECKAIRDKAQAELDRALPMLDKAVECLKELNKSHIDEVRNFKKPPPGVVLTMEAACIMLRQKLKLKIIMKADPNNLGKTLPQYWETAQKYLLKAPRVLLETLKNYDKDNIPERIIKQIEPYVRREDFQVHVIENASKACRAICMWVHAMFNYHEVSKTVDPLRVQLAVAEESLAETMAVLDEARGRLQVVEDRLKALEDKYDALVAESEALEHEVEMCQLKLERANKLIGGLGGEKERWKQTVADLEVTFGNIPGDVMVSAGAIAYLGAFTSGYRTELTEGWRTALAELKISHTEGCSVRTTLADPVQIRAWNIAGLPTDTVSTENGIIMSKARRWPLMIDPQGQAGKFIKNLGDEKFKESGGMDVTKLTDKKFLNTLENGIRFGRWILLDNIGETLDPALEPLLLQQIVSVNGAPSIKLGDNYINYNDQFHLYITTKLPNPHYAPELQVKVTLLNFTITVEGLQDQMLGTVVAKESPEMEQKKSQLVVSNARMKKQLQDAEDEILYKLSTVTGDILEDEELIESLARSKKTSEEIIERVAETEIVEKEIDAAREVYTPVAVRASILYFCIAGLAKIDPMYQYSLQWFVRLFINAISNAPSSSDQDERLKNLNDYFTMSLYQNICRSLFNAHKILFSLTLTVTVLEESKDIDPVVWRFLVAGGVAKQTLANPCEEWLSEGAWDQIRAMSDLKQFDGFAADFKTHQDKWLEYFDSAAPHIMQLPGAWDEKLTSFQRLLVLKCLRPDKMANAVQDFVAEKIGPEFNEPPAFNIAETYTESSPITPLIFVLSRGADPASALFNFAHKMGFRDKLNSISLGQGQGKRASKMIEEAQKRGGWVLLQNCHLAISWLPSLEVLVDNIDEDTVHTDFRLWLTSLPTPHFPVSILQNGVKMTNEPPKGIRANLMGSYLSFTDQKLNSSKKPHEFKKLLYALCFFHAVILDRRKFGPLGWNVPYDFTENDLGVCITQLGEFIDMYDEIPYQVIHFLTYDINYGGRVTDSVDRDTIRTILDDFINPQVLSDEYQFSASGEYSSVPTGTKEHYLKIIKDMPLTVHPEVFGMHENADITSANQETQLMFETTLKTMSKGTSSSTGRSREDVIYDLAGTILDDLPQGWEIDGVMKKYPTAYNESMNTVLVQEVGRYNRLLHKARISLSNLQKALRGVMVMTTELETMADELFNNVVPGHWEDVGYPTLMSLAAFIKDLVVRCQFLDDWIANGTPVVFWISGFFFPQAFLTGTLQNFARKTQKPIDTISFNFHVLDRPPDEITQKPKDGVYIHGLNLEGCRWDPSRHSLVDSKPKELFTPFPVMWLLPEENRKPPERGVFKCPVYKILTRRGTLSTTGHSTNFVLYVEIPTSAPPSKWIKAGVALFCALRY